MLDAVVKLNHKALIKVGDVKIFFLLPDILWLQIFYVDFLKRVDLSVAIKFFDVALCYSNVVKKKDIPWSSGACIYRFIPINFQRWFKFISLSISSSGVERTRLSGPMLKLSRVHSCSLNCFSTAQECWLQRLVYPADRECWWQRFFLAPDPLCFEARTQLL